MATSRTSSIVALLTSTMYVRLSVFISFLVLDIDHRLQMHSSLVRRLSLERELEDHQGCVNTIAWNSKEGHSLISGSDDMRMNIWSYSNCKLLHSIETGHTANIFCTKFVPETSDELVVSGAGDAEVEVGNPNVVWSASEDGTLRQHDFRERASCPPAGSSHQRMPQYSWYLGVEVLLDLRCGAKKSLADPPKQFFSLKSCDISSTRPHLLLVGGSDAFARLYDRRMLPPLSSSQKKFPPPPCVNYFCPMHLSDHNRSSLHLTHVAFSPNGEEVLLSYSGEHVYLMDVIPARGSSICYSYEDAAKLLNFNPTNSGVELQSSVTGDFLNGSLTRQSAAKLDLCRKLIQAAEKILKEETSFYYGIEACNEVLDGYGDEIGPKLISECLCIRAALLLKIGKYEKALEFAIGAQSLAPYETEVVDIVDNLRKTYCPQVSVHTVDITVLRSIPGWSRSDRGDSDDEELELAFETLSGDEGHENWA
nr:WD and tetratricopeptide repeats protein 1 isoform X1 [Ipomoea batatas]